jgi:predicted GNAT family N-acyltransferase
MLAKDRRPSSWISFRVTGLSNEQEQKVVEALMRQAIEMRPDNGPDGHLRLAGRVHAERYLQEHGRVTVGCFVRRILGGEVSFELDRPKLEPWSCSTRSEPWD